MVLCGGRGAVLLLLLLLIGCGRDSIRTYRVPKAPAYGVEAPVANPGVGFRGALPGGWSMQPGVGMRRAEFVIPGSSIDFYLIVLKSGDLAGNLARWGEQVGLAASASRVEALTVGGNPAQWVEFYNDQTDRGIVAVVVERPTEFWYFTAKGPAHALRTRSEALRTYVESIAFGDADAL